MPRGAVEAANKTREQLDNLAKAAETLQGSDGFKAWLDTASKFRTYSFNNQIMIMSQCPNATRVAGYKAWQALGRNVRKGEHGIKIFAPMIFKNKDQDADAAEVTSYVRYRIVSVFDISQTEGDPLPSDPEWAQLTGDETELYSLLGRVSTRLGVKVSEADAASDSTLAGGARGYYQPGRESITIDRQYDTAERCAILLHELGHAASKKREHRGRGELIAESVAYLLGQRLGLDNEAQAVTYVSTWSADRKTLAELAGEILSTTETIQAAIDAETKQQAA